MRWQLTLLTCCVIPCWPTPAWATLIVNSAQAISHRVTVQMIQTALDNGTSPATLFGNAAQQASIEAGVDKIWAQAGIDIDFLPNVIRYNNTFAYQGFSAPSARPDNDLGTILSNATAVGKVNPTPSVINEFFVNIVPHFTFTSEISANGFSFVGSDGSAQFVGDSLLTSQGGQDVVASVVAHELGHVLGLFHTADGSANLMAGSNGTSQQLSNAQIAAVFQAGTGFPQPFTPPTVLGDYNHNSVVDAADYTVWRNTLGSRMNLAADGNHNQIIDIGDFNVWKTTYGNPRGTGAGAGDDVFSQSVPEPATLMQLFVAVVATLFSLRVAGRQLRAE